MQYSSKPTVSAFYFPNYHADARNEARYGKGWTEWDLLRKAVPRFPGHQQPLIPVWGYENEADPQVMQRKITAASTHGISNFIFDWYYYNDEPFLSRALDDGFLGAQNSEAMTFCLMWANHDWFDIFPGRVDGNDPILYPGTVTPETFDKIINLVCENYFQHPRYFRMGNKPFFSLYHVDTLIDSLGGEDGVKRGLDRFRERAESFGLPGVHLNAIGWSIGNLKGEEQRTDAFNRAARLGFDSATSYVWVHHVDVQREDLATYDVMADRYFSIYEEARDTCPIPVFPNVTMGWDPSPRTSNEEPWKPKTYPYSRVLQKNTPEAFGRAISRALQSVEKLPGETLITINAWNEWTEGSYLEPDSKNGFAYLEAIHAALGNYNKPRTT